MEHTLLEPGAAPSADGAPHRARSGMGVVPRDVGAIRFVDAAREGGGKLEDARARENENEAFARLDVCVEAVTASARGQLAERIDDAIERELHARRAGPPGIGAARDADGNLSDQLFRARHAGATHLVLTLPRLAPLAGKSQTLGSDDSATLVFWARATRERPVSLRLDASDSVLCAHVDPIPLRLALDPSRVASSPLRLPRASFVPPAPVLEVVETLTPIRDHTPAPEPVPVVAVAVAVASASTTAPEPAPDTLPATPPSDPAPAPPDDTWRSLTLALTAARGPQPLAAFERLFAASYLPLDTLLHTAALSGAATDPRAVHARDDFRDNFSRVYLEAFHAFAATGKRPKMVLDAPEIAARIARQMSARTSQILLVDSMRFDIGGLVKEALSRSLGTKAALTNELILWSALPTTTTHQLATLSRGAAALAETPEEEREDGPLRGRTATTIRRMKIGSRDVYRLDLCDVRVREAGERVLPLLPSIASDVAEAITRHARTLAPRTLLLVFGDHGFSLGRDGAPLSEGHRPRRCWCLRLRS